MQKARRADGNTLFLDAALVPHADQWAYLGSVRKVSLEELQTLIAPIGFPALDGDADEPHAVALRLDARALDLIPGTIAKGTFARVLAISRGTQLELPTGDLPVALTASLKRLGTLPNPEFYEKQRLRFPTYNIPRFIFRGEIHDQRLVLPRGTLSAVQELIPKAGGRLKITDTRPISTTASFTFRGTLSQIQQTAADAMLAHEEGVLVAPPGAGQTVMGCALIAARGVRTLVLAHRKPLLEQWRERCGEFLGIESQEIHIPEHAKNSEAPLAVGMLQTLARSCNPAELLAGYGQVILGLTATPTRKDGLQKILFMQCGPIRHRIEEDRAIGLTRRVVVRELSLRLPPGSTSSPQNERMPVHVLWELLAKSETRNRQIAKDIVKALGENRCAAVLSDRKEHLIALEALLREMLPEAGEAIFRIDGSMPQKQRAALLERLQASGTERRSFALLSTSSLLGEGFDLPLLDTLFLAMSISFKGRIIPYAGRLHRTAQGKTDAQIYDYVEADHRLLAHMRRKRISALRQMGYTIERELFG